jgi:hypothetical protein
VAASLARLSMVSVLWRARHGAEGEGQGVRGSGGDGVGALVLLITSGEVGGMWQGGGRERPGALPCMAGTSAKRRTGGGRGSAHLGDCFLG